MLNDEILALIAKLFEEGHGPSHDELDRAFARAGLSAADPKSAYGGPVGKLKRVRAVLGYAIDKDPVNGFELVKMLVGAARAAGSFRIANENYAGRETIESLRAAFRRIGFDLDAEGCLRPSLLENLEGHELTDALWAYVRRARTGATDTTLVVGTSKNLEEAVARHVLKELTGTYQLHGNFPTLLGQAFSLLALKPSTANLDSDPTIALQEALFLLACAVNRLRNAKGDGHGRPEPSETTELEARLCSQSAGIVCDLLLTTLERSKACHSKIESP